MMDVCVIDDDCVCVLQMMAALTNLFDIELELTLSQLEEAQVQVPLLWVCKDGQVDDR